ncbi:MAG: hypothetical protein QGH25_03540 [Candidatus Latescibacteria bacterium]|nr:hypothetical protein [Candidatus Latescibacterota bacterium]
MKTRLVLLLLAACTPLPPTQIPDLSTGPARLRPPLSVAICRYLSLAKRNRLDQGAECAVRCVTYDWDLNDQRSAARR